jgi:hypothetical protein
MDLKKKIAVLAGVALCVAAYFMIPHRSCDSDNPPPSLAIGNSWKQAGC